jgi:hypothetical protein
MRGAAQLVAALVGRGGGGGQGIAPGKGAIEIAIERLEALAEIVPKELDGRIIGD